MSTHDCSRGHLLNKLPPPLRRRENSKREVMSWLIPAGLSAKLLPASLLPVFVFALNLIGSFGLVVLFSPSHCYILAYTFAKDAWLSVSRTEDDVVCYWRLFILLMSFKRNWEANWNFTGLASIFSLNLIHPDYLTILWVLKKRSRVYY